MLILWHFVHSAKRNRPQSAYFCLRLICLKDNTLRLAFATHTHAHDLVF